jgi:aspartate/methionine/tyrosine aminotransferase
MTPSLSARGSSLVNNSPIPEYIVTHHERALTVDPEDPERYIGLCVAENFLMWDLLDLQINRVRGVQPSSVAYDSHTGSQALREQIARFGSEHVWGRAVDADQVVTLAGAGSILESLFYVIAAQGEGVLVPTPSYAGYWFDIETRDDLTAIPVHTRSDDGFRLTPELLEEAFTQSTVPIAALILTNPDNPTGRIMASDDLKQAIEWARSHDIHIIVNGIYALSVHSGETFVPVASIVDDVREDIHEIWGFSKDFAMSGLRAGVLTTQNQDVLSALNEIAYWSCVSGDTQHLLVNMLTDDQWLSNYIDTMRQRLAESYRATTTALDTAGIPYMRGDAGLYLLADFRQFMDEASWESEDLLWRRILDETNVNLTPGSACRIGEPGFMRICFATEPPDVVTAAIERVASLLND